MLTVSVRPSACSAVGQFGDERDPVRPGRRPGAAAVGEGERLVVEVDAVVVALLGERGDGADVRAALRRIGEQRGHLPGVHAVGDRRDDRRALGAGRLDEQRRPPRPARCRARRSSSPRSPGTRTVRPRAATCRTRRRWGRRRRAPSTAPTRRSGCPVAAGRGLHRGASTGDERPRRRGSGDDRRRRSAASDARWSGSAPHRATPSRGGVELGERVDDRVAGSGSIGTTLGTTITRQPASTAERSPVVESSIATHSVDVDAEALGRRGVRLGVGLAVGHLVAGDDRRRTSRAAAPRPPRRRSVATTSSPARSARRWPQVGEQLAGAGPPRHPLADLQGHAVQQAVDDVVDRQVDRRRWR